jgi:hypothetical protein
MRKIIQTLLLALGFAAAVPAADLTGTGDWVFTINATNLRAGAGSDLQAQFESLPGTATLTITNTASGPWTLRARRNSTQNPVVIYVKRTSAGNGNGSIGGGTTYIELTGTDTEICSGDADRSGVAFQFKMTGLTCEVPPSTYFSNIIFTVQ